MRVPPPTRRATAEGSSPHPAVARFAMATISNNRSVDFRPDFV